MSDNSSNHFEGRGYNSDDGSYSTPQVSSSLAALAGRLLSGQCPSPEAEEYFCRGLREWPAYPHPSFCGGRVVLGEGLSCATHPQYVDLYHHNFILLCLGGGSSHRRSCRFHPYRMSTRALVGSTKHKADSLTFAAYWANILPMPFHLYSDPMVLKATVLAPGSAANLRALKALRATYNVSDHFLPPHPAVPATSSDQQPLNGLRAPDAAGPVVVSSASEEDEVTGCLLRRFLPLPGLSFFVDLFIASLLTWAARFRPRPPARGPSVTTQMLLLWDLKAITLSPLPALAAQVTGPSPLAPEGPSASRKRKGSPPSNPRPTQSQRRSSVSRKSSADPNHEELISSLSTLGDKVYFFKTLTILPAIVSPDFVSPYISLSSKESRFAHTGGSLLPLRRLADPPPESAN
ncbi:hypothetical protein LIER_05319 [Lithospermum erythrorhizon]|uniref:Uncharacterized protein n=1 Tax=Lithospermum erythrorhizon TaxID=34254 RepID=A0AAV3P203_LITER